MIPPPPIAADPLVNVAVRAYLWSNDLVLQYGELDNLAPSDASAFDECTMQLDAASLDRGLLTDACDMHMPVIQSYVMLVATAEDSLGRKVESAGQYSESPLL